MAITVKSSPGPWEGGTLKGSYYKMEGSRLQITRQTDEKGKRTESESKRIE